MSDKEQETKEHDRKKEGTRDERKAKVVRKIKDRRRQGKDVVQKRSKEEAA